MSANTTTTEIIFKGIDGNECEEFIAAIEELAFTEGWSRDRERMLLFARSRLRQRALRWFAKLDPSKKEDWNSFVDALFDQYPSTEVSSDPTEPQITTPIWSATTFSPAPSTVNLASDHQSVDTHSNAGTPTRPFATSKHSSRLPKPRVYDPSSSSSHLGVLRIVAEGQVAAPLYICRGRCPTSPSSSDSLGATIDRQEALVVCFIPAPQPHTIGCLNTYAWAWDLSLNYFPYGTSSYQLHSADRVQGLPKITGGSSSTVSVIWNVLPDGSLQATLSAFHTGVLDGQGYLNQSEEFKTTEVHLATSGHSICFVKPSTHLCEDDPEYNQVDRYEMKARIVFEPL